MAYWALFHEIGGLPQIFTIQ